MMTSQKSIFLHNEANQWFERNKAALKERCMPEDDLIASTMMESSDLYKNSTILEIGCADGFRLSFLEHALAAEVYGIDPSSSAIDSGKKNGLNLQVGTADNLEFADNTFDIVILGFCLYLCDRSDLFRIAAEIDRVTKDSAWIIIQDFFSESDYANDYSHFEGVKSYKSDYRKMFTWHPAYSPISHKLSDHSNFKNFTDNQDEWIALSIIRKNLAALP